jgi:hypothetical protein
MTWRGYVSGSATLFIQGDTVDAQGRQTGAIDRPDFHFNASLPTNPDRVGVTVRRGRGAVKVVEQPLVENQYTATVQISPVGNRPEYYVLDFYWKPVSGQASSRDTRNDHAADHAARTGDSAGSGEIHWAGDVDRQALVTIAANQVSSADTTGGPALNEHIDVTSALPGTNNLNVRVADAVGRGKVQLVETPNAQNGYRAVVRITDPGPGVGSYSFRLVWNANSNGK